MQKTNLKELIKQVNRYSIKITTTTGQTTVNASDFLRTGLINLGKKENVLNISYYKQK